MSPLDRTANRLLACKLLPKRRNVLHTLRFKALPAFGEEFFPFFRPINLGMNTNLRPSVLNPMNFQLLPRRCRPARFLPGLRWMGGASDKWGSSIAPASSTLGSRNPPRLEAGSREILLVEIRQHWEQWGNSGVYSRGLRRGLVGTSDTCSRIYDTAKRLLPSTNKSCA